LLRITEALLSRRSIGQDEIAELLASNTPHDEKGKERKLLLDPILARALDPSQVFFSNDGELV